jgi:hypothetical protein
MEVHIGVGEGREPERHEHARGTCMTGRKRRVWPEKRLLLL